MSGAGAQAGVQGRVPRRWPWMPAFAGMTKTPELSTRNFATRPDAEKAPSVPVRHPVAKRRAGIHNPLKYLDSCFRGTEGWARCGRLVTLFVSFFRTLPTNLGDQAVQSASGRTFSQRNSGMRSQGAMWLRPSSRSGTGSRSEVIASPASSRAIP
jgi:hypothetical protein